MTVTEVQVTSWRDLPSLVVAREVGGTGDVAKVPLPARFQEAIDEAAMRLGETGSDAYLAGWGRSAWEPSNGSPAEAAARRAEELETAWDDTALTRYLEALGPSA